MRPPLLIALIAGLTACGGGASGKPAREGAEVRRVIDGDTIVVATAAGEETVRLLGIDTPERAPQECGHRAATRALERLAGGREVELVTDPTQDRRDRHGRLLAYVDTPGGRDLGEQVVRRGWARVYVFDQPFARVAEYRDAYDEARARRAGLFRSCA